jgi:phospholipid N-methyltransferase
MLEGVRLFLKEFRHSFVATGAIAPSSPGLAKAMVQPLRQRPNGPIRVLEVGPGTGAFTLHILKTLRQGDQLDLVEMNPSFCRYLTRKLERQGWFDQGIRITLHQEDIRRFKSSRHGYHFIISSLPFGNFDAAMVADIMNLYLAWLAPNGVLSYFEYAFLHTLRLRLTGRAAEHERLAHSISTVKTYVRKHQFHCIKVWLNLPPARARHLRNLQPGQAPSDYPAAA